MQRKKSFFKSVYVRKFGEYKITAADRFGVNFTHTAYSKKERDVIKKQWQNDLTKELPPVIEHIPVVQKRKAPTPRIDPIYYYYTEECKDCGLKYSVENFHATMLDENGDSYFMPIMKNDKVEYVAELPVAKFYLMTKKQRDNLKFDERYINYWKSYRFRKDYYLIIVLPEIKFRNNQIGFYIRVVYGKEITYMEAKRIWTKIDSVGFAKFEILFSEIPVEKSRKRLTIDARIRKQEKEHLNKLNIQLRHILKNECVELESKAEGHQNRMRIKVPKHYRIQRKVISINAKFGNPMDRVIKKQQEQIKLNNLLRSE